MYTVYLNTDIDSEPRGIAQAYKDVFDVMKAFDLTENDIIHADDDINTIETGGFRITKSKIIHGELKDFYIDILVVTPAQELNPHLRMMIVKDVKPLDYTKMYELATACGSYL